MSPSSSPRTLSHSDHAGGQKVGRASVGHQADLYEHLAKPRLIGGDDDVGRECLVAANADRWAVHSGDDGLWKVGHREDRRVCVSTKRRGHVDLSDVVLVGSLKIRARAKSVAATGQDNDFGFIAV